MDWNECSHLALLDLLNRLRPIKVTVSPSGAAAAAIVSAIGEVVQVVGCQGGGFIVWLTQLWS